MPYSAWLFGSLFIQSDKPFICTWTEAHSNLLTWTEHRTARAARQAAKKHAQHNGAAYAFDPFAAAGPVWKLLQ